MTIIRTGIVLVCVSCCLICTTSTPIISGQENKLSVTPSQDVKSPELDQQKTLKLDLELNSNNVEVTLVNRTGKTVAVWERWNSWGYRMIYFNVRKRGEKKIFRITRKEMDFLRNFPSFTPIFDSEYHGYIIDISDTEKWGVPVEVKGLRKETIQIQAVLQVPETDEAVGDNVFVGIVKSKWRTVKPPHKWF
ncbi:hypothetical protein [Symmachiella dynata]|uniref:hypothetical protein n=1 Tax=Symmachiella dynata TaxID=2527995 RepID=UPI0030ECB170